ncbi:KH homology domain-containing protein 4-like isoform X1 [Gadus macrocephalus]|uniref:KH homology domain-containing protein 4-like isoform X1 n=1 Tax=Gadus macrocephalus TaxID=80720 RepID=UPI0028CB8F36|nr:KH homology domain-containing protein 4-like isoform X1 [Gadus macrocephalus]
MSWMTGQTPCLTSRWDQPAPPKQNVDVLPQTPVGNSAPPSAAYTDPTRRPSKSAHEGDTTVTPGGVEMAAAMAAKINAMLMAKGKLLTPPPLLAKTPMSVSVPTSIEETVVTEVDINDVPINCRDLLTKGKTQEEIRLISGAVVSTKGRYMSDAFRGKGAERPLYLHVQGKNQEQVNKAVLRIKEIISEDVLRSALSGGRQVPVFPPLTLYPQPPRAAGPPAMPRLSNSASAQGHRPAAPHSGSFVHTKIFVGLDQALPSFNVNDKVEGPGGTYLGHIQTETGARVFLRGKTSGYIEQASKRESFEPLYVYISHPNSTGLEAAKKLTESLLETVRAEHSCMVSNYTATGSTQPYAAQGFPPNSNYSSQGSWYSYPANGYAGGYTAYPGAAGYWSNSNGPPSHSNLSTNPQSSQAMVQYPVCPRKPHPYLVQDRVSSDIREPEGFTGSPPTPGSPKRHFQEESQVGEPTGGPADAPAHLEPPPPASNDGEEMGAERVLMPPPPPLFAAPLPIARKRPREVPARPAPPSAPPVGVAEQCVKKCRVVEDSSGLVPYGGDSSDEEEERTHSSS